MKKITSRILKKHSGTAQDIGSESEHRDYATGPLGAPPDRRWSPPFIQTREGPAKFRSAAEDREAQLMRRRGLSGGVGGDDGRPVLAGLQRLALDLARERVASLPERCWPPIEVTFAYLGRPLPGLRRSILIATWAGSESE